MGFHSRVGNEGIDGLHGAAAPEDRGGPPPPHAPAHHPGVRLQARSGQRLIMALPLGPRRFPSLCALQVSADRDTNVYAASSDTAVRLLEQAPEILRRWERRVRAEVSGSKGLRKPVLRNRLGFLLASVARVLSPNAEPEPFIKGLSISQDHGAHRALTGEYSLADVFLEYRVLRETVREV